MDADADMSDCQESLWLFGRMRHFRLVGQGKKFELWDEDHWQKRRSEWLEEELSLDSTQPDELKLLSL